jgi:hypothetical protein
MSSGAPIGIIGIAEQRGQVEAFDRVEEVADSAAERDDHRIDRAACGAGGAQLREIVA